MKKKSKEEKSEKKTYYFTIICLSSDIQTYEPMTIIKKYLTLEQSSNIKYGKNKVEYDHSTNAINGRMTRCKFIEVLDINIKNSDCPFADSYLIFINLESEGIETQIDTILNYINKNGNSEKKFYFIGIYLDKDNVDCLNEKDEMTKYLGDKEINFEYEELNFNSSNELVKILSYIANDTLKNKMDESLNQTLDKDQGQGDSICIIF